MIINNDEYNIIQDKKRPSLFYLHFLNPSKELIKSLTKTNILQNTTIDETYNTLIFKADNICTLLDYLDNNGANNNNTKYEQTLTLIYDISKQIEYLNHTYGKTFYTFSLEKIIVIDNSKFCYISNEHLININTLLTNGKLSYTTITISEPFKKTLLMSPELLNIKYIPEEISYKSIYYSLALISLLFLFNLSDDEEEIYIFLNQINNKNEFNKSIKLKLENIKGTKLYSFLMRALNENPEKRTLLFA